MRLSHWSLEPYIPQVWDRQQKNGDTPFTKPAGLWVSVDGQYDWEEWCRGNMADWLTGTYRHTVTLRQDARIYYPRSPASVTKDFGHPGRLGHWIDWEEVARVYEGIVIAPYSWEHRLDFENEWYYGWDCASGCIWDGRAIESVRPIFRLPPPAQA